MQLSIILNQTSGSRFIYWSK